VLFLYLLFFFNFFNFSLEMVAIFLLEIGTKNSRFSSSQNQKLEEKNTIFRRVLHMVLEKVFFFFFSDCQNGNSFFFLFPPEM